MKGDQPHIITEATCSTGNITLRSDNILTFTPYDHITSTNLEELKEQYDIFMKLTKETPHLFYMNSPNLKRLDAEERVFIGSASHHFSSAMAIRENSAVTRFIVHSIMYINKPLIPVKMFKNEKSAINWLKSLKL